MSLNQIPRDKNGKPLKFGQIVEGVLSHGMGPPKFIIGKLAVFSGLDKSLIEDTEGRYHVVENKTIEIKID
jgi:hypothetical protein